MTTIDYKAMLEVANNEAHQGLAGSGIPIGAVVFNKNGVEVIDLNSQECIQMLGDFIAQNPEIWNEDIGEE